MRRWISYQDQENAEKYVSCLGSRNSTLWGLRPADRQLSLTWMNTKPSVSSTGRASPRRNAAPICRWPGAPCSPSITPPGKNWRRPWWTGGLCGSRAGTISSVTGVRSTAAAAAAGGTVWPVWVGQSKEDVTIKIAVPLDENGQDVSWPGPPASCSGRTRRTWFRDRRSSA